MSWKAPRAASPVTGLVSVPGSKSITNRALVLASLSSGPSKISNPLISRDTQLMISALQALGISFDIQVDSIQIFPGELISSGKVEVGLAGTVMRFVPIIAALAKGATSFDGDPQARMRPMQVTIESLRSLGVEVQDDHRNALPFVVVGKGEVTGSDIQIDASASSQFISALLLAGSKFKNGLRLTHTGEKLPSVPHIEMTISMLSEHGVSVAMSGQTFTIKASPLLPVDRVIEPDLSNAAAFLAAAMVTAGRVSIPNWPSSTTQAGDQIRSIFSLMGAAVDLTNSVLTVTGPKVLKPLTADLSAVGELTPVIAAVCAFAPGVSTLTGIAHLRGHETNRLLALSTELDKVGVKAVGLADGLEIFGGTVSRADSVLSSYHDHRMAMFAAILGLNSDLVLDDVETTSKTLPNFADLWTQLVAGDL